MTSRIPFSPLAIDQSDVSYEYGPDSAQRPEVVSGSTTRFTVQDPRAYPGTSRSVWFHLPAETDLSQALPVVVFQDGGGYLDPQDDARAATVLDNLIASGEIPPMVGVFVDPGEFPDLQDPRARRNRNAEYDAFDSRYADFLLDEVLPRVADQVPLSDDPADRALCGHSSGGNAAFTAAWCRPDGFGKVIALISSFAQISGGNPYPASIAAEPAKPIRIFLQEGHRDLGWNEPADNWLAENLKVAAALAENGYDFRLVLGDGGHDPNHGCVLLPDAMRWLWRDAS